MNPVHRSIFLSAVERYGSLVFFLLSTAILSRLLTPAEFGVFAIVNALTVVLAAAFQEFGGSNYLVQRTTLSRQNIRTAFTVTLTLSVIVGVALFTLADAFAALFAQDALRLGIAVSVLNFALWPFSVTITALLRRDMNFGTLAACNLAGNFVAAAISILLAVLHFSFMAPIWGALAGNAATTLLLIIWQKDPGFFRPSLVGYREVMRFGVYSSGVVIINVLYNFAPQLVLARVLDFAAAGLYSRAVMITQVFDKLVVQVLSPVIMPAILAQTRASQDLKRIYLDAIELLTAAHWPFLSFFAIMAQPIVLIWLGPMWTDIVPLVRMLCIAYLALFAACLTYPVLVAVGSVRDALISSAISLPPSLVVIFISAFFGVEAVAAAALLCLPFQAAVAIYFISRHLAIGTADLFGAMRKSGIVTAFSISGPVAAAAMVHAGLMGPLSGLFLAGATAATGWLLGLIATDHPLLAQVRSAMRGLTLAAPKSLFAGEAGEKPPR